MKIKKNDGKWKVVSLILVCVLVFVMLFTDLTKKDIKDDNQKMEQKISDLENINAKLSQNINELNESVQTSFVDNEEGLNDKFNEVSNEFVKIYPAFNIEKIEEKRAELEKITTKNVASSIVPDDMITSSKRTLDSDYEKEGEAYSSDPTFKSNYKESNIYTKFVSSELVQYFAEITYVTESSSGDTQGTIYILFDVSNQDGKIQVTNFEIKYF